MFKGKKAAYALVILNIAIWGFFIYRFYTAYTEVDEIQVSDKIGAIKLEDIKDSATYKLSLDYGDPFLREVGKGKNNSGSNENYTPVKKTPTVSVAVKSVSITSPKQLPEIKYLGLVKNNTSGASTALVSLNGQSKIIKVNDVVDGITFKSFNRDSLVAKWGKEKIVVKK